MEIVLIVSFKHYLQHIQNIYIERLRPIEVSNIGNYLPCKFNLSFGKCVDFYQYGRRILQVSYNIINTIKYNLYKLTLLE